jgi:ATP synthase protein I
LALLVAGLSVGCLNAWLWVDKQDKAMRDNPIDNSRDDSDE